MVSKREHVVYVATLVLKGVFALGETLSGLVLYFQPTEQLLAFAQWLLHQRVFVAAADLHHGWLRNHVDHLQLDAKNFVSIYLIAHGLVKVGLVLGLLSEKRWAFPVGLAGLGAFVAYQLYHFAMHGHIIILILAALDVFIMWLVWREWKEVEKRAP